MRKDRSLLLRARWVLPMSGEPVENGLVAVEGKRIRSIGRHEPRLVGGFDEVLDFGDSVLLPGLINAHCHLDYSSMGGMIPPVRSFLDWIKSIMTLKASWSYSEFAESWTRGARMLLETGTTTVVDFEASPEILSEVVASTPLRVFTMMEMTNAKSGKPGASVLGASLTESLSFKDQIEYLGLAPHAPYSTSSDLLEVVAEFSRQHGVLTSIHVAESREEFEMYSQRGGSLFDWLSNYREMDDCGGVTPVGHLERHQLLSDCLLAVHANCLTDDDIEILARNRVHVVHCPRSHEYFSHDRFRCEDLMEKGVNVCLGTDSLASVGAKGKSSVRLDLREEMKVFQSNYSEMNPKQIVEMVTLNAARAIHRSGDLGCLEIGSQADLIAIPCDSTDVDSVFEEIVQNATPVSASILGGMLQFRN